MPFDDDTIINFLIGYAVKKNPQPEPLQKKLFKAILGEMISPEYTMLEDSEIIEIAMGAIRGFKELNSLEGKENG